jgi:hypothetical protein
MPGWVTLEELKNDQTLDQHQALTGRDDEALQRVLDAAQSWVEHRRRDLDYHGSWTVPLEVQLGTLRLAMRWFVRRVSPDGTVNMGGFGTAQVMSVDPDIQIQLGITGGFS